MAESFELDVLRGLGHLIADASASTGVPLLFDGGDPEAEPYPADAIGIYLDRWPEIPGGSVTLADYTVSDDLSLSDSVLGIQATIRHRDRLVVKAIGSSLFTLLHGRQRSMLGTVTLVSASRQSGTNAGQDSNERQGRIENYYLAVHRPSANRI